MIKVKKNSAVNTNISILIGGYDAKMTSKFLWESNSPSDGMVANLNDSLDNYDEIVLICKNNLAGSQYNEVKNIIVDMLTDSRFTNIRWGLTVPVVTFTGNKRQLTITSGSSTYFAIIGIKY